MLDAAGSFILENDGGSTCVVRWRGRGYLGSEGTYIMVCDAYGSNVDDVAPVVAGSGVSSLVEDDAGWIFDEAPLSKNADLRAQPFLSTIWLSRHRAMS